MDQESGRGGNILVIDDDRAVTDLFLASLTPQGHRVVVSHSGFQAMRKASDDPFDIVFLDINMPGLDGAQTLRALRGVYPGLFVVIITGLPDDPRVAQMLSEGAVTCIAKPFGVREIIDATAQLLELKFATARKQPAESLPSRLNQPSGSRECHENDCGGHSTA
jgi:DNA-binding NtrC family response regulator